MARREAIDAALAMFRRPAMVRAFQEAPLPEGMITVIRLAAGADVETGFTSPEHARNAEEARNAAIFFLQQILFHPQSDNYRLLGLAENAKAEQVREHKRLLLKRLHPDRNPNKWESALFQRVIKAAEDLERRLGETAPMPAASTAVPVRVRHRSRRKLRQFAARRVRNSENWLERLTKSLRRFAFLTAVVVLAVVTWRSVTGKPLSDAFASLADGSVAWLRW